MATDSGTLDGSSVIIGGSSPELEQSSQELESPSGKASSTSGLLKFYEVGRLIVVGFGGNDLPSDYCIAESRQILCNLVRLHDCKELVFDLTGVRLVPSGMLGVIASMRNLGVQVAVCNPSPDFREVLATTQLDTIIQIRDVEISGQLPQDAGSGAGG
ncbi:MAG: STAS domain-containing protein [Planctomycetaceae bacterium]